MGDTVPVGRIEQFNQITRSLVTLILTVAFVAVFLGFARNKTDIDTGVFANILATVLGFWFGSREARVRATDAAETARTAATAATTAATTAAIAAVAPPTDKDVKP